MEGQKQRERERENVNIGITLRTSLGSCVKDEIHRLSSCTDDDDGAAKGGSQASGLKSAPHIIKK